MTAGFVVVASNRSDRPRPLLGRTGTNGSGIFAPLKDWHPGILKSSLDFDQEARRPPSFVASSSLPLPSVRLEAESWLMESHFHLIKV